LINPGDHEMKAILKATAICTILCAGPGLAQSDPIVDAANRRKAESEAETAALTAAKTRYEAETAAAKARFGTLADYTTAGTTEAGDKAGRMEAQLLSADSIEVLAAGIVGELNNKVCRTKNIVIATPDEAPSFEAYDAFRAQYLQILKEKELALLIEPRPKPKPGTVRAKTSMAAAGTALNILGNLFRSDYKIAEVDWDPDDLLLARSIMEQAQGSGWHFFLPKSSPASVVAGNPAVDAMLDLETARNVAAQKLKEHQESAKKNPKKDYSVAIAALEAVIKHIDEFNVSVRTPDKGGAVPLVGIARQAHFAGRLSDGFLLVIKSHVGGGTTYTKKNFWTFFGSVPFYVSGGALTSYALLDGKSGEVVASGVFDRAEKFTKVRAVAGRTRAVASVTTSSKACDPPKKEGTVALGATR
jgi:hypothetical protein